LATYRPYMQDQVYKVTSQRQMALLSSLLFIHTILVSLYLYYYGFAGNIVLLISYFVFFTFDGLPTIILHLQYLSANRYSTLVIHGQDRMLSYTRQDEHLNFSFDDIEKIIYVAGLGNGAWYSFSEYRYFVLVLRDERKILISSLMMKFDKKDLERIFGMPMKQSKLPLFPLIRKEYR